MLIPVSSVDDPRVAIYRDLPRTNATRDGKLFIAEGQLLVERLAASSFAIHSVLVDERRVESLPPLPAEVPVYVTPPRLVEQIVGFNFHRGVIGCGYRGEIESLGSVLAHAGPQATVVVAAGIQDPTNLGSMLRNCAAFGVDAVLLSPQSAAPFSRRVLRVSMGTVFKLRIAVSECLLTDLRRLRDEFGFERLATLLDPQAEPLHQARRQPRTAVLFGNEAHGLPADVIAECDRRVTIPMSLETDSLNAAVASGVVLYHFTQAAKE